jgi:ribosomal protein S18 acetylase RimI-like enzyme
LTGDRFATAALWRERADAERLSIRELMIAVSGQPTFVGSPATVVETIDRFVQDEAADGFVLVSHLVPGGLDEFADTVVALLRERGVFRTDYAGTTLRDHLGLPPLRSPGAAHRRRREHGGSPRLVGSAPGSGENCAVREQARRATADDVTAIARIADRAYRRYLPRMAGARPAPMDADYADAVAHDEVWVLDGGDGAVLAFVVLVPGDGDLLLENVAVDPDAQGEGLGRALLDLAEDRARTLGAGAVWLFTHVMMTENQRIYAARGYVETDRRTDAGLERVFFRKAL